MDTVIGRARVHPNHSSRVICRFVNKGTSLWSTVRSTHKPAGENKFARGSGWAVLGETLERESSGVDAPETTGLDTTSKPSFKGVRSLLPKPTAYAYCLLRRICAVFSRRERGQLSCACTATRMTVGGSCALNTRALLAGPGSLLTCSARINRRSRAHVFCGAPVLTLFSLWLNCASLQAGLPKASMAEAYGITFPIPYHMLSTNSNVAVNTDSAHDDEQVPSLRIKWELFRCLVATCCTSDTLGWRWDTPRSVLSCACIVAMCIMMMLTLAGGDLHLRVAGGPDFPGGGGVDAGEAGGEAIQPAF